MFLQLTEEELKRIKEMYEAELQEARNLLETNSAELAKKQETSVQSSALIRDLQSRLRATSSIILLS